MPFYLKYDGANDRVDAPTLTLGVNDYVEIVITDYTGKGGVYHFLTDGSSDTNRLFFGIRTTNRIEIPSGTTALVDGSVVANDGLFTSVMNGADHTVRLTNTAGTKNLGRIGSRFNNVETWPGGIKSITVSIGGVVTTWNGNAVDTSSTTWAPVSGSTNLTLVNFTLPAAWVFYSSGATYQLTALGGTFSYAGAQASLLRRFKLQTLGATYAYSGASANLTYGPTGTVYTLTALGGSFSYSGAQASLLRRFRLVANGGTYSYAGGSANLTYNQLPGIYRLTALGATYTYTGGIAALTAIGVTPTANPGAYVIQAYVGGVQTISAKIGGKQTINAMVAI